MEAAMRIPHVVFTGMVLMFCAACAGEGKMDGIALKDRLMAEQYHQKYLVKNPGGYFRHVVRGML